MDATGGGNIFLDHLRTARLGVHIVPVVITNGHHATVSQGRHHVPKHDLITTLEALFRERRLQADPKCPHTRELVQELHAFERLTTSNGRETFTGKASTHDDLVIALALAAWKATQSAHPDLVQDKGIFRPDRLF